MKNIKINLRIYDLLPVFADKTRKILFILAKYGFLFSLIFILLDIIIGEFLFYRYIFIVKNNSMDAVNIAPIFKTEEYKSVLSEIQDREIILRDNFLFNYSDPFQKN